MQWETVRTIDLGHEQLLVLKDRRGTRVRVLYGALWLTEENGAGDRFPASGDEVVIRSRGVALLEGVGVARVQLIEPRRDVWRARLAAALRPIWRRLVPLRWRRAGARAAIFFAAGAVSLALLEAAVPGPPLASYEATPRSAEAQADSVPAQAACDLRRPLRRVG